jgi:phospholipid/cholesterol/gamma-HCH transport system permease protein
MAALRGRTEVWLSGLGGLYSLSVDSVVAMISAIVHRRFVWREFIGQAWFIASVCILPTVLIAIPFGIVISLQVGNVARQVGATSFIGAIDALGILREAAPIVTALLLSGAGGSAICADLGSRNIKDEIDALRVLGLSPVERLVAPRVLAGLVVAMLLNGIVAFTAVLSGYIFDVTVLHGTPGSFLGSFSTFAKLDDFVVSTLKAMIFGVIAVLIAAYKGLNCKKGAAGVGIAVNQSVVLTPIVLFIVNLVITEVYFAIVPPQIT